MTLLRPTLMGITLSIAILVLIVVAVGVGSLLRNRVPIFDPPGPLKRLPIYLSTNTAETKENHLLPELRPRQYSISSQQLFEHLKSAVRELGWKLTPEPAQLRIEVVIVTPWLRFRDDLEARVVPISDAASCLYVISRSRLGRADYGANLHHILDLYAALERNLPPGPNPDRSPC